MDFKNNQVQYVIKPCKNSFNSSGLALFTDLVQFVVVLDKQKYVGTKTATYLPVGLLF